ncbi:hypothetical protein HPB47_020680 [Ixodes persulcatus]|uniref:Uncharacterized protein n=1 Tax=Ixodes persulcatus TaxID=34615 RepID=A0AC60QGQ9_IXOPE|nr:hypothetical protein HPB47_020680 [Ixodes persulcatus]
MQQKQQDAKGSNPPEENVMEMVEIPTRIENSVSRDTSPYLTFSATIPQVEWSKLEETLSSDHHIVQTQIQHHRAQTRLGHAKITNWPTFRKEEVAGVLADIEEWTQKVTAAVTKHTKTIQLTTDNPEVDPHLLHMWEARQGLLRRWKRQKRNRKLKAKIAQITRQAEEYAERLGRQNWNQVCDQLAEPKATSRQEIQKPIHNFPGKNEEILEEVKTKVFGERSLQGTTTYPDYEGEDNPELERPFTRAEVEAALGGLTRNTAPGRDRINYKTIRNLDGKMINCLTKTYLQDGIGATSNNLDGEGHATWSLQFVGGNVEAHTTSQLERLKLTAARGATLQRLGYRTDGETRGKQRIPLDLRNKIKDLAGNKAAHTVARDHILRAFLPIDRALFNLDEGLSREEAVSRRQLQTKAYPHGTLYRLRYPACYEYDCKACKVPNNLYHMVVWGCQAARRYNR